MRRILLVLLLASLSFAITVRPDYIGVKDTGNEALETLVVEIGVDCDTTDTTVIAYDSETELPVDEAEVFLFYTDYGYNLISSGTTDQAGTVTLAVPGNINFLRALFILRVDADGYRSREIEFTYEKCVLGPEETEEEEEAPPSEEEAEEVEEEIEENVTGESEPEVNVTEVPEEESEPLPAPAEEEKPPEICSSLFLLILGTFFSMRLL